MSRFMCALYTLFSHTKTLPDDVHHGWQNFHNLPTSRFPHHLVRRTSPQCHLKQSQPQLFTIRNYPS